MSFNFNDVHDCCIHNNDYSNSEDGRVRHATASTRVSDDYKKILQRVAEAEGVSDSEFFRQALRLRTMFVGKNYYKLLAHAEDINDLLKDMEAPMIVAK